MFSNSISIENYINDVVLERAAECTNEYEVSKSLWVWKSTTFSEFCYVRNKPKKRCIKLYVVFDANGLLYDFILHQRRNTELNCDYSKFGQVAAVVMQLIKRICKPNIELYFGNYFLTFHLFEGLKENDSTDFSNQHLLLTK